jgi:chloramphenicol 3-O-phosphotransferase
VRPAGVWDRLVRGYLGALRSMLDNDVDVVAEAVIVPELKPVYGTTFDGVRTLLVGVRCPLPVAKLREAERVDRPRIELDVPQWTTVHDHAYDLEIDTSGWAPMQAGADAVLARFLEL